jgi:hypothetical protein
MRKRPTVILIALAVAGVAIFIVDRMLPVLAWDGACVLELAVTVTDAVTGLPVKGAAVSLVKSADRSPLLRGAPDRMTVATDAEGRTRLVWGFPAGGQRRGLLGRRTGRVGIKGVSLTVGAKGYQGRVVPVSRFTGEVRSINAPRKIDIPVEMEPHEPGSGQNVLYIDGCLIWLPGEPHQPKKKSHP